MRSELDSKGKQALENVCAFASVCALQYVVMMAAAAAVMMMMIVTFKRTRAQTGASKEVRWQSSDAH